MMSVVSWSGWIPTNHGFTTHRTVEHLPRLSVNEACSISDLDSLMSPGLHMAGWKSPYCALSAIVNTSLVFKQFVLWLAIFDLLISPSSARRSTLDHHSLMYLWNPGTTPVQFSAISWVSVNKDYMRFAPLPHSMYFGRFKSTCWNPTPSTGSVAFR